MKKKLQFFEISTLIYFCIRSSVIGIGVNAYLFYGKVDAYLSILIGIVLGILPLVLFIKIWNLQKEKNIHEIIESLLGKRIGCICSAVLGCFVLFYGTILFYDLINFIASEYLYKTPSYLIGCMILIPMIYLLSKDLHTFCRTSVILFFLSIILFGFSVIGLTPKVDFENLLPFLEHGITGPLKGAFVHVSFAVLPIFTLTIIPKKNFETSKNVDKHILLSVVLYSLFAFFVLTDVIGVLGIDLAQLYQYPDYHLLRRIQVGGFIQRTESILAIQWVLCLFMMISFCIYFFLKTLTFLFPKKKTNLSVFLFPILMLITSRLLFPNNTVFIHFTTKLLPVLLYFFFLGIPCLLFALSYKKNFKKFS